jgi:hypothetical protein
VSYCRSSDGDSDVYVYHHVDGYFVTVVPGDPTEYRDDSRTSLILRLGQLRLDGLRVPQHALNRLYDERADERAKCHDDESGRSPVSDDTDDCAGADPPSSGDEPLFGPCGHVTNDDGHCWISTCWNGPTD